MDLNEDYYKVLRIKSNSNSTEIKRAFRKRALMAHPDRVPTEEKVHAEQVFKKITEAYYVLGNDERRTYYNQHRKTSSTFSSYQAPSEETPQRFRFSEDDELYKELAKEFEKEMKKDYRYDLVFHKWVIKIAFVIFLLSGLIQGISRSIVHSVRRDGKPNVQKPVVNQNETNAGE
jgi:curved DNA-binding protein CbpA